MKVIGAAVMVRVSALNPATRPPVPAASSTLLLHDDGVPSERCGYAEWDGQIDQCKTLSSGIPDCGKGGKGKAPVAQWNFGGWPAECSQDAKNNCAHNYTVRGLPGCRCDSNDQFFCFGFEWEVEEAREKCKKKGSCSKFAAKSTQAN